MVPPSFYSIALRTLFAFTPHYRLTCINIAPKCTLFRQQHFKAQTRVIHVISCSKIVKKQLFG